MHKTLTVNMSETNLIVCVENTEGSGDGKMSRGGGSPWNTFQQLFGMSQSKCYETIEGFLSERNKTGTCPGENVETGGSVE